MPRVSNKANKYAHKKTSDLGSEKATYFFLKNAGIKSSSELVGAFAMELGVTGRTLDVWSTGETPLK